MCCDCSCRANVGTCEAIADDRVQKDAARMGALVDGIWNRLNAENPFHRPRLAVGPDDTYVIELGVPSRFRIEVSTAHFDWEDDSAMSDVLVSLFKEAITREIVELFGKLNTLATYYG